MTVSVKRFTILSLLVLSISTVGCYKTSVQQPLAPGYNNSADQQMGTILAGARAFYVKIQQDSASGAISLSPTEKTAFNDFGTSLNLAEPIYLAYHNGTGGVTLTQAQQAVNSVAAKQAALPIPGGK